MSKAEDKLKELGLTLPNVPKPVANYVPYRIADGFIYTAGQGPMRDGKILFYGKVGGELTVEEGKKAAEATALNLLAILKEAAGSLDNVEVLKMFALVASAPGFYSQPEVINGASDLLVAVLGERGRHARSAVAAPQLPFDTPVEIELVARIIK